MERRRREDRVHRVDRDRVEQVLGQVGHPVGAEPFDRGRATIDGDASRAITWPRGRRSRSASVTWPVPQPASSTVSSPRSRSRSSDLQPPSGHRDREAVVGRGVPVVRHGAQAYGEVAQRRRRTARAASRRSRRPPRCRRARAPRRRWDRSRAPARRGAPCTNRARRPGRGTRRSPHACRAHDPCAASAQRAPTARPMQRLRAGTAVRPSRPRRRRS